MHAEIMRWFLRRPQAQSGTDTKQPSEKRDAQRQPSPTPVGPPEDQMGNGTKFDAVSEIQFQAQGDVNAKQPQGEARMQPPLPPMPGGLLSQIVVKPKLGLGRACLEHR
jgi:hypothetical protein